MNLFKRSTIMLILSIGFWIYAMISATILSYILVAFFYFMHKFERIEEAIKEQPYTIIMNIAESHGLEGVHEVEPEEDKEGDS